MWYHGNALGQSDCSPAACLKQVMADDRSPCIPRWLLSLACFPKDSSYSSALGSWIYHRHWHKLETICQGWSKRTQKIHWPTVSAWELILLVILLLTSSKKKSFVMLNVHLSVVVVVPAQGWLTLCTPWAPLSMGFSMQEYWNGLSVKCNPLKNHASVKKRV